MRLAAGIAILTALAACEGTRQQVNDRVTEVTRNSARAAAHKVIDGRVPGGTADKVVDCIIDNAEPRELLVMAKGAVIGVGVDSRDAVLTVARRAETLKCYAREIVLPIVI